MTNRCNYSFQYDDREFPMGSRVIILLRYYDNDKGKNPLNTFRLQPQTANFEAANHKTFTEVLYPKEIYDIINYFVRECVKREQPMRVCKNCKRYFAITGRLNTEYCDHPINGNGRICKDVGAINLWNEKRKNDEVFKIYRREYKKRFSWIKAGKIAQDEFYAWSEKAREEKAKCDSGEISMQRFSDWLKKPDHLERLPKGAAYLAAGDGRKHN